MRRRAESAGITRFPARAVDAVSVLGFPNESLKESGRAIIARVREGAPAGWTVICNEKNLDVGGERVPSPREMITATMAAAGVPDPPSDLAATLWAMLSGTSHSVRYAITSPMEEVANVSELRPTLAAFGTTSEIVHLVGAVLIRCAILACSERLSLMGWADDALWRGQVDHCQSHIAAILASIAAAEG